MPSFFLSSSLVLLLQIANAKKLQVLHTLRAGAFLIPYTVVLVLCGIPLFGLEVALAQYWSASPVKLFDAVPLFRGVLFTSRPASISVACCLKFHII